MVVEDDRMAVSLNNNNDNNDEMGSHFKSLFDLSVLKSLDDEIEQIRHIVGDSDGNRALKRRNNDDDVEERSYHTGRNCEDNDCNEFYYDTSDEEDDDDDPDSGEQQLSTMMDHLVAELREEIQLEKEEQRQFELEQDGKYGIHHDNDENTLAGFVSANSSNENVTETSKSMEREKGHRQEVQSLLRRITNINNQKPYLLSPAPSLERTDVSSNGEEVEDNSNNENDEASVDQNKSFVTALERIDVSSNEEEAKDNNYNDQNNIFATNNKEIVKNPVHPPIIKDNNEDRQTLAQQKCHSKKRKNRRKQVRLLNGRIALRPTNIFFFGDSEKNTPLAQQDQLDISNVNCFKGDSNGADCVQLAEETNAQHQLRRGKEDVQQQGHWSTKSQVASMSVNKSADASTMSVLLSSRALLDSDSKTTTLEQGLNHNEDTCATAGEEEATKQLQTLNQTVNLFSRSLLSMSETPQTPRRKRNARRRQSVSLSSKKNTITPTMVRKIRRLKKNRSIAKEQCKYQPIYASSILVPPSPTTTTADIFATKAASTPGIRKRQLPMDISPKLSNCDTPVSLEAANGKTDQEEHQGSNSNNNENNDNDVRKRNKLHKSLSCRKKKKDITSSASRRKVLLPTPDEKSKDPIKRNEIVEPTWKKRRMKNKFTQMKSDVISGESNVFFALNYAAFSSKTGATVDDPFTVAPLNEPSFNTSISSVSWTGDGEYSMMCHADFATANAAIHYDNGGFNFKNSTTIDVLAAGCKWTSFDKSISMVSKEDDNEQSLACQEEDLSTHLSQIEESRIEEEEEERNIFHCDGDSFSFNKDAAEDFNMPVPRCSFESTYTTFDSFKTALCSVDGDDALLKNGDTVAAATRIQAFFRKHRLRWATAEDNIAAFPSYIFTSTNTSFESLNTYGEHSWCQIESCSASPSRKKDGNVAAAIRIQAFFRGGRSRSQLQLVIVLFKMARWSKAAVTIQAWIRGWVCRQSCGWFVREFLQKRSAASVVIQTAARGWIAASEQQKNKEWFLLLQDQHVLFLQRRNAPIKIQAVARGWLSRERLDRQQKAAIQVQAITRGLLVRNALLRSYWANETAKVPAFVRLRAVATAGLKQDQEDEMSPSNKSTSMIAPTNNSVNNCFTSCCDSTSRDRKAGLSTSKPFANSMANSKADEWKTKRAILQAVFLFWIANIELVSSPERGPW